MLARGALLALTVMSSAGPAWAGTELVLSGPVDAVVAAGDRVAVVQGSAVRLLSSDGRARRWLGRPPAEAPPGSRPPLERRAEDALELAGIPEEERDSAFAEDLVDDDLGLRERRAGADPPADRTPERPLLAAAGGELWAFAGGAIWHVTVDGRVRRAAGLIPALDRLSADAGGRLLAAAGAQLWSSVDGGATFAPLPSADGPVRALAAAAGRLAWASDTTVSWSGAGGPTGARRLPGRAVDLRFCGGMLLALHEHGLVAIDPAGDARELATPPAARLGCGPGDQWWLIGPGLLVSSDQGQHFDPVRGLPPVPVADAAAAALPGAVWLATPAGLFLAGAAGAGRPVPALDGVARARGQAAWASLVPRVVVAASSAVTEGRRDLRAVAYADFPFGRRLPAAVRTAPTLRPLALQLEQPLPLPAPTAHLDPDARCLIEARAAAVALAAAEAARARSLLARAGQAAWLPELRLRIDRRLGRSESLNVPAGVVDTTGPLGLDTVNDVRYEARATWDLSRLVFSPDEIAAEAQALRMADVRRDLESLVNRVYFERRRLIMDLEPDPAADPASRARRAVRAEELLADLEALSGGAFGRCVGGRGP